MTQTQAFELLASIFRTVFERDGIVLAPETTARDVVGWDSFAQVEIVIALERQLERTLSTRELDGLQNVGDLARLLTGPPAGT